MKEWQRQMFGKMPEMFFSSSKRNIVNTESKDKHKEDIKVIQIDTVITTPIIPLMTYPNLAINSNSDNGFNGFNGGSGGGGGASGSW